MVHLFRLKEIIRIELAALSRPAPTTFQFLLKLILDVSKCTNLEVVKVENSEKSGKLLDDQV